MFLIWELSNKLGGTLRCLKWYLGVCAYRRQGACAAGVQHGAAWFTTMPIIESSPCCQVMLCVELPPVSDQQSECCASLRAAGFEPEIPLLLLLALFRASNLSHELYLFYNTTEPAVWPRPWAVPCVT